PGDRVLDPFLGSGTTLKVCQTMGRSGVGFEINRGFLPLIVSKIREPWKVPDWRDLDILHSSTITPGSAKPRKSQFSRRGRRGPSRLADGPAPEGNEDQRA
ncbi:MAG: hypothetical protein JO355_14800, partial [Planctomycetaceae bacterium]|nr:hypothetical protein [Planctomycetaceae bacterium]